jgi:hypothetical protein
MVSSFLENRMRERNIFCLQAIMSINEIKEINAMNLILCLVLINGLLHEWLIFQLFP